MINLSLQKGLRDSVIAMNPSSQNNIFVSRNKATIRADRASKIKEEWNYEIVADRLEEAARVLKRMPPVKVQGYFSSWPQIIYEKGDLADQEPKLTKRPAPDPKAISRMEETLGWTVGLPPLDAKIVWMRAYKISWKVICSKVGLCRKIAFRHRRYGLQMIAWKLDGKVFKKRPSLNQVIMFLRLHGIDVEENQEDADEMG